MRHVDTLIIGAGLSGISAAYHLKGKDFLVIEKSSHPGGLCTSEVKDGFTFDQTGHWLHLAKDSTKALFNKLFGDEHVRIERKTFIFSHDVYTIYPFQSNTYGLPLNVVKECVVGFVKALYESDKSKAKENFYEWCMAYLGEGISKHFMIPYNSKIYTVHPKEMASHWCDYYVPKPTLEEVVEGAITSPERKVGYNASFYYPKSGGIGELVKRFYESTEKEKYLFNTSILSVDTAKKSVKLSNGTEITYKNLITSAPLKEFLLLLEGDFKEKAKDVSSRLKIAQVSYLNIAVNKKLGHNAHWVYLPEEQFMPYRMGSFSNIYSMMAPESKSSVYIEYTHQGELKADDQKKFVDESIKTLIKMRMIERAEDVIFADYRVIPNGYVIFHQEYFDDMKIVNDFASLNNIQLVGRYGRWTYNAMENAILDGMEAAAKII